MRRTVLPSILLAAALGAVYVVWSPPSADLAAAVFRIDLFERAGFVVVNDAWYGGHHVPAYSLLAPPLGALLGPQLLIALAAVAAAGLFAALVERAFEPRAARLGALWFAAAVGISLLTGRVPFLLGLPIALGALLAAQRGRPALAVGLALLAPLASPVVGAFLALAGVAWFLGDRSTVRPRVSPPRAHTRNGTRPPGPVFLGLAIAAAGLAPVLVLNLLFPEGGTEPFVPSAFWPALAALLAIAIWLPREQRVLRVGAALYALAVVLCFAVPNPVGGNVTRLAALAAGPLVLCAVGARVRPALLAALVVPFAYWQAMPAIRDVAVAGGDPSTSAAFYAPLVEAIERDRGGDPTPIRVEVPFTRAHWEAARLAPDVALARGWQRQLDRERNPVFYDDEPLTEAAYQAWLRDEGIAYVALPDVPLDDSALQEAALLEAGVDGLREVWRDDDWRLFAVGDPTPLGVQRLGPDGFSVAGPGDVRVRFSPHWAVVEGAGCVSEAPGGFTRVERAGAADGPLRVGVRVDPLRAALGRTGPRCSTEDPGDATATG